jgi:PPK2 family polyphosphate:nucleotide phosphotransferase
MANDQAKRLRELRALIEPFRVEPGRRVRLPRDFDPGHTGNFVSKKDSAKTLRHGVELLADLQARLAAQDTYGLLVVFQAMDAAGKDGTIKHVMSGVNPQGVRVSSFKEPSSEELDHDYLWRYARRLPGRGTIGIFNRSYYEEVLVVRVHPGLLDGQKLPPGAREGDIWKRRFREINEWERYLVDNGIRIVKLFLNVSRDEQRRRFLRRIDDLERNWKFSSADVRERARWDDYQAAFSDVLSNTSTDHAPWWVIPADHKWFMRVAAGGVILNELARIDPRFPTVSAADRAEMLKAREELLGEEGD